MAALSENDRLTGPFLPEAGETDFAGDFPLLDAPGDVAGSCVVFVRERAGAEAELVAADDFTITVSTAEGFTLQLVEPSLAGDRCWILGRQKQKRLRAHTAGGSIRTPILEDDAREAAARAQEAARELDRAATTPIGEPGLKLPSAAVRRGKVLGFTDTENATPIAVANDAVAVAEDLALAAAARQGSETARDASLAHAETAGDEREAAEAAAAVSTTQAGIATTQAGLAESYVQTIIDDGRSFETDAAGRLAVLDGEEYWLRTTDGGKLRTRVDAATSTDWLDSEGDPYVMVSLKGVLKRERHVSCTVTADGANNNYTIQPADARVDLTKFSDRYDVVRLDYRCPKPNTVGSGSVSLTLNNGDGTLMWTRAIVKLGNVNLDPGDHAGGDHITLEILLAAEDAGQRFMWLLPSDVATKKLARLAQEIGPHAMRVSPDRPLKWGRRGENSFLAAVRPPPDCYLNGAAPKHTDTLYAYLFDMGTFQADPASMTLQGFADEFGKEGLDETANYLFSEISGGLTTNTGLSPSTYESVVFGGDYDNDGAVAANWPASGRGHGFQFENVDTVTLMRNDVTTRRVVTAATAADPVVLTVAASGMTMTPGMTFALQDVVGMVELNGLLLTVDTVVGTTVTTTTDGSAFTAFVSHAGSIDLYFDATAPSIADGFEYGDALTVSSTMLCEGSTGSAEIWARGYYDRTLAPDAAGFLRFQTRFDPDDADVTVTPGFKRAVMVPIPLRNVDRLRARRAGVWDPTEYQIDLRDASSTSFGQAEALCLWHSTNAERLTVVVNNLGYGTAGDANTIYSHWEDSGSGRVSIAATVNGYVSNNAHGPKVNHGILEPALKRDITGIEFGADYSIAKFFARLTDAYTIDDALEDISAIIPGLAE